MEEILREGFAELGIAPPEDAAAKFRGYYERLAETGSVMNLTAIEGEGPVARLHFLDSAALLSLADFSGRRVIDVGTGAGFPGLPLAIARPDLQVVLLDSLNKRLQFLSAVVERLGLTNVRLVHARAEDAGRDPLLRERFDIAAARAVAPLPVLCELLLPFVRVGGHMACYKGPAAQEEWQAASRAAKLLGGGECAVHPVVLPTQPDWQHTLITCPKVQKTLRQYPRKAGTPSRQPLGGFVKK